VTSVYEETAGQNILTVENCNKYSNQLQSIRDMPPHQLSPLQLCEQKLHLSRYLDLPLQIAVNKQWILCTHLISYASPLSKLIFRSGTTNVHTGFV